MKGCPLRCRWCHNIEMQSARQQIYFYPNRCIGCRACAVCPGGARIFLRCIILRGIHANAEHLAEVSRIFQSLRHCEKVVFLPCHSMGGSKAQALGLKQENAEKWVPEKELMDWVFSYAFWEKQSG